MANVRGDLLDFSPTNFSSSNNKENNNSLPVLSLIQFSRPPFLSFGTVKLGSSKSALLLVENPSEWATELKVDKIASNKGFSVEQTIFTVPPGGGVTLAINWTPVEDGGVRELVVFLANGIVKHQVVLLGKAEAQKKKKKSLWDSIKKKKSGNLSGPCKGKGIDSLPKSTVNKTFRVPRQVQYTKERARGPLGPFNKESSVTGRIPVLAATDDPQKNVTPTSLESCHLKYGRNLHENVFPFKKDSPIVLLVPAATLVDTHVTDLTEYTADPECHPDCKSLTQVLNRSHLPSEHAVKEPVPCSDTCQIPDSNVSKCGSAVNQTFLSKTPVLTVKDALQIIQSDLTPLESASPPNACSSFDFSDSLELSKEDGDCQPLSPTITGYGQSAHDDLSFELTSVKPRLTFFVKSEERNGCQNDEGGHAPVITSKMPFTSVTVIKRKGNKMHESSLEAHKSGASRRLVLENTLGLSQDDLAKPNLGKIREVCVLPVIDSVPTYSDSRTVSSHADELSHDSSPVQTSSLDVLSNLSTPAVSVVVAAQPSESLSSVSNHKARCKSAAESVCVWSKKSNCDHAAERCIDPSDFHCKKRKSDEFLKESLDENVQEFQVKRSRVFPEKRATKPFRDRIFTSRSVSEKLQKKTAASKSSRSSASTKPVAVTQPKMTISRLAKQRAQSVKSCAVSSVKSTKNVAVAQSHLTFIKPAQTAIPRHPLPFAAKNMFYDERWIEKQERGFTMWINYILTPDEFKVNAEVTKVNAVSLAVQCDRTFSVPKAPTKEEMSLRTYTARRRLNRLRRIACQLFTSEPMVKAIQRLELEVEAKRLLLRKDRHLWKDIGQRQKVLNWLLSYNPLWLRIGLETIYGELISLESSNDVMGLAVFIVNRLLWNPDIAAQYRHPKVPHLYRNGHEDALSSFTLKKLLLLVCFLDKAKESKLIEHDPCLFCMDAEFKTSKDLLLAFSRDFLSGEGILPRHLSHLGFAVSHSQTLLDEFDFAVKNLAVDLRCGVRLVRIMELLSQNWNLSQKLRMPAISRLQKVHNVDIAFLVLKSKGIELKDEHGGAIDSRDIVDGHREKTITLLWKIIFAFQVEILLDEEKLKEEICFLQRMWKTRQELAAWKSKQSVVVDAGKTTSTFEHSSRRMTLLMDWVNAVCAFYKLKAENFTVSFSDGRVLCCLVHHYHPCHVPLEAVCQKTTQTVECVQRGTVGLDCSSSDSDASLNDAPGTLVDFSELLENERRNFQLLNCAVSSLGGVPAMITPDDMSNTIPNEKVVTCYLSFLCARILDLRTETRAAWIIQGAWKKYRLKKEERIFKERSRAAAKIQLAMKRFLLRRLGVRRNTAAVVLQSAWRGQRARRKASLMRREKVRLLQNAAATFIQARWRRYSAVKRFQKMRLHAVVIQARVRMTIAVAAYRRVRWAVITIQEHRKAWLLGKEGRRNYLSLRSAAVVIQRCFRRWRVRSQTTKHNAATVIQSAFRNWHTRKTAQRTAAALKIQSWYRARLCRRQYVKMQQKAVIIQAWYRGFAERKHYQHLKLQHSSAVTVQKSFKAYAHRKRFLQIRHAALVIQNWYRACKQKEEDRLRYLKTKRAAVTLQAAYHGHMVRKCNRAQHTAAVVIQAAFRMFVSRKRLLAMKRAAMVVQQHYRAKVVGRRLREEYLACRRSALKLQALWRGRTERKRLERLREAAVRIQCHYRRHAAQVSLRWKRRAAAVIQSRVRAHLAGRKARLRYLEMRRAAVTIQSGFRGMRARRVLRMERRAATLIQATFKAFVCKCRFLRLKGAATIVQRRYRARLTAERQQQRYTQLRQATIKLQAAFRGFKVRRDLRHVNEASAVIQACFRMRKARLSFMAIKCAAVVVQRRYRAYVKGQQQREEYLRIRRSAVILQSAFRGSQVRLHVKEMHRAATVIQAHFRGHKQLARFTKLRWAVSVVRQRRRAVQLKNAELQKYRAVRKAAVCLQSAFRGMKARRHMREMQEAARTIQRSYVAHQDRIRFLRMKAAAVKIQQWYRAVSATRVQLKRYRSTLAAIIKLQAACRGTRVRKELQTNHRAATVIQAAFRMYRQRVPFKALKLAAVIVQQRYRCHLKAKQERERFLTLRRSAVVVQAAFRGRRVRRHIDRMHSAALVIQARFRMQKHYAQFKRMCWAVKVIQDRYRASRLRDSAMQQYRREKAAAVVIQAAYRGYKARQNLNNMHKAASVIQRRFLAFRTRRYFLSLRAAIVTIQNRYKALVAAKAERATYVMMRSAAVTVQAAYRGLKARRQLRREHKAAVIIQSLVRRHLVMSSFRKLRRAAEPVQKRYRANKLMKEEMRELKQKLCAVVLIQASFRATKVRQQVRKMHKAACNIQRAFRAHRTHKWYLRLKSAVLAVQSRRRAATACRQQRQRYLRVRGATATLQAACRGWKMRKALRQQHEAATVLQTAFRRHRQMVKYQAMRLSALVIQSYYRSHLQSKQKRETFLRLKNATITIQAAFRRWTIQNELEKLHKAATLIQATFRMHRQRAAFTRLCWAVSILQQRVRAGRLRDAQVEQYQTIRKAAMCLQATFRAKKARQLLKQKRAVHKIQSFVSMSVARRSFLRKRAASVVIQSAFRRHSARIRFTKMQAASVLIQRWYRACKIAQNQKAEYLAVRQAAMTLQRAFRGMLARRTVKCVRSAVKVQSVLHMYVYRKRFLHLRSSVVKIQAHYRMFTARRQFMKYRMAAVMLQRHYRAQQEMRVHESEYLKTLKSIHTIQAWMRGHIERKKLCQLKSSAIKIQAFYRGIIQRRKFQKQKGSVAIIQAYYRAYVLGKKERTGYMEMRKSAVLIQAAFRGHQGRRRVEEWKAAIKIQAWFKGNISRTTFLAKRSAAVVIQSTYRMCVRRRAFQQQRKAAVVLQRHMRALRRGRQERQAFLGTKAAAVTLQAFCRGWLVRRRMTKEAQARRRTRFSAALYHHLCAVKIQRALRAHWALQSAKKQVSSVLYVQRCVRSWIQRKRYLEDRQKVVRLQGAVRQWLCRRQNAATVIQCAVRTFLDKRRKQRAQRGVAKLQALWRGHLSRRLHDTRRLVALRHRLRRVNLEVREEDKLCNKMTTAIDYLLRYKHFSYILAALKHLETATRLSPECCEHLVQSGATTVIFTLIRSCNRSIPCMEVISYAVQVLLNLSKYDKTRAAVYRVQDSVETLVELMQMYREKAGDKVADKGGSIFTKTCFLLAILLHDRQRATEIRALPKVLDRIGSIYRLTVRKHQKDVERTAIKQKMNASLNGSFFPQTPSHKLKPNPRFAPDWVLGMKYSEVVEPLRAIQMVADAFGILP